jgi:hypothetical protein
VNAHGSASRSSKLIGLLRAPKRGDIARVIPRHPNHGAPIWNHDSDIFDEAQSHAHDGDTVIVLGHDLRMNGARWWVRVLWHGHECLMDGTQLGSIDE